MSCCKKNNSPENEPGEFNQNSSIFIVLIIFILLAIILGGVGHTYY